MTKDKRHQILLLIAGHKAFLLHQSHFPLCRPRFPDTGSHFSLQNLLPSRNEEHAYLDDWGYRCILVGFPD